ncbi:MAG TPA: hypothetical protein VJ882_06515, partial [Desulfuromonadales bacterium]|nr:hypothetical protein [Desulfuromonadales bacterium]
PFAQKVYACEPPSETAVEQAEIVACVRSSGSVAQGYASVDDALAEALREKRPGETVLVAGSLFLVAAARKWLLALKGAAV